MSSVNFEALDPRGDELPIIRVPLATRVEAFDDLRVVIVLTMPPGSGLEAVEAEVRSALRGAAPAAAVTTFRRRDFMIDDPGERTELAGAYDAVILIVGPAATSAAVSAKYAAELESAGLPTVLVTTVFVYAVARHSADALGTPLRVVTTAEQVVPALSAALTDEELIKGEVALVPRPAVASRGSLRQIQNDFSLAGWTDGLPIIPPTSEAVQEMLSGTSRQATDLVTATMRPEGLPARVREVAIAAVMAGARPPQLPIILAAAEVLGDLDFQSMTRSVNSFAFAYLVNGPVAAAAGMTGDLGAIGPGHPANATIGRTLGLLPRTVGGARLGVTVAPTQGNPAAWAFAFAENEDVSPWTPFQASCGFEATDSTVSVFTGGWSHLGNFYYGDVDEVIAGMSKIDAMTGVLLLVSAKRATALAQDGWTREAFEGHLWERVTMPIAELRSSGFFPLMKVLMTRPPSSRGPATYPESYLSAPKDAIVPRFPRAGVRVAVVGGEVSSSMQLWAFTHHATVSAEPWL